MVGNFYPRIREICVDVFKSCYWRLDPNRLEDNFEVFGLDFMID